MFCVVCFKTNSGKNVSECGVPVAALTVLKGDKYFKIFEESLVCGKRRGRRWKTE